MKKELEDQLYAKYDEIFFERNLDMTKTCLCWGISTGDGWYDLLDKLCSKIMTYCKDNKVEIPHCGQVKEKFATLRFYCGGDDNIYQFIREAEEESGETCEDCGSKTDVAIRGGGWLSTRCQVCWDKKMAKKN